MIKEKGNKKTFVRGQSIMVKIYSNAYPEMGLTSQEAKRRMEYEGPNEIAEKHPSAALRLARKFWGPSAWMVEVIALVSLILHKRADLSVALLLLGVIAVVCFNLLPRATSAIAARRQKLNLKARALRDGRWQTVPTRTLVKG